MSDLSREELKAHLSSVEAQVRGALKIVASESKSVQQANNALRADLSAALIRLQSDMSKGNSALESKMERLSNEVEGLGRQRRIFTTMMSVVLIAVGIVIGILAADLAKEGRFDPLAAISGGESAPDSANAAAESGAN